MKGPSDLEELSTIHEQPNCQSKETTQMARAPQHAYAQTLETPANPSPVGSEGPFPAEQVRACSR